MKENNEQRKDFWQYSVHNEQMKKIMSSLCYVLDDLFRLPRICEFCQRVNLYAKWFDFKLFLFF